MFAGISPASSYTPLCRRVLFPSTSVAMCRGGSGSVFGTLFSLLRAGSLSGSISCSGVLFLFLYVLFILFFFRASAIGFFGA